jgi:predicted NBD/HSP70 family sugar kinase
MTVAVPASLPGLSWFPQGAAAPFLPRWQVRCISAPPESFGDTWRKLALDKPIDGMGVCLYSFVAEQYKLSQMAYELPGQRSETVRRANLSAILRELHNRGPVSRSELGARTGLTRSAVRGLIGELALSGLVSEQRGTPQGTPGRPSPLVRPSPRGGIVLALEIAVDSLAVAAVGIGGDVLDVVRLDRPRDRSTVDETIADLAALARAVQRRLPDTDGMIGIGVAIVGIVRRDTGVVSMAPNLGWRNVPLADRLADALGTSLPIAVANEADLGALAELRRGAAVGSEHVVFISGEVGVGGGLIVDGKQLTGAGGYAGEVGHMPVNPNGRTCRCGSVGCWETEVGEGALLRRAGHPPDAGRDEVEAVLREAAAGSPDVLEALDAVGRWLGFGLAGLVNVFNPQVVVLGGLFGRIHPFVETTLGAELDRLVLPQTREAVRVLPAALGVDAPLLGAAELAFEPLLADPSLWTRPAVATA